MLHTQLFVAPLFSYIAERLAEEARLAEIERLRLEEEERQRKAEEDRLAREAEAARLAVEAERIGKEKEGLEGLWKRREHNLETLERKAREVAEVGVCTWCFALAI